MDMIDKKTILNSLRLPEKELEELSNICEHKIMDKGDYFIAAVKFLVRWLLFLKDCFGTFIVTKMVMSLQKASLPKTIL